MNENITENIDGALEWVFRIGLLVIIATTFFLFWNLTTEFYETPKFLSLALFVGLLLILSSLKYITQGKVAIVLTPLDLPLLAVAIVAVISTFLSASPTNSGLGSPLRIHGGLATTISYILFYYLLTNNLKSLKDTKIIITTLLFCGAILAGVTIASYVGIKILPFAFFQGLNFTTTGSSFSTAAILTMLLPFPLLAILRGSNKSLLLVQLVLLVLFGTVIVLVGSWPIFMAAIACLILVLWVNGVASRKIGPIGLISLIGPIAVIALIVILSFVPPVGNNKNPLFTTAQNFPREVQLPFATSWKVSVSSFRDSSFFGTGPATYLYNFTQYKPLEFNSTPVWNTRFDMAFNEYLQVLATLGGLGFVSLLALTVLFVSLALKSLVAQQEGADLAISGLVFFIILGFHGSTLTLWVVGIIILSMFIITNHYTKQAVIRIGNFRLSSPGEAISLDILPVVLLIILLLAVGLSATYIGKFAVADYQHRKALNAVARNDAVGAYNSLIAAEKLNPYSDLYRADLAQTNFAIANAIAINKGPTSASPSGSLNDGDRQNIQQLLQQAINEGQIATNLNPRNVNNWETLGNIYRNISGVAQNALQFALDAYGRAIALDPLNPALRLNVGGIYYSIKNYEMAIRFFSDAVNLKPDFANGYYNLSVALRDKGNLDEALIYAERTVSQVDPASMDSKLAADYLKDLRARIATGSAKESQIKAPAGKQQSALEREKLPNVINLPEKEDIATPEAIKKP